MNYYYTETLKGVFREEHGVCCYLDQDGKWVRDQGLLSKIVFGNMEYEPVSKEIVDEIVLRRREKESRPEALRAMLLAAEKHSGQKDKNKQAYIFHPLRVAASLSQCDEKITAYLHDTLEDTDTNIAEIKSLGISGSICHALCLLCHDKGVPYEEYVKCVAANSLAATVKSADILDNLRVDRLEQLPKATKERLLKKYTMALRILQEKQTTS